ncbi:aspartate kinase [Hathewaya histolytica]|uniref:Aspartokinase n=1 Tax=Hathewaya histolytica TaxID=1498 RepID=A0A4U9RCY2_HATHI|nr:aspartate kinase [Hathewaya histolytica]VTQ89489.1 aspartate kinase [Hathewaya histolytica]
MKLIIQKFGGTSVSTEVRRKKTVEKIKGAIKEGYIPIVVVSAMGRIGSPYATDTLISLITKEFKNKNLQALDTIMSCGEIISTVVMCNELFNVGIEALPLSGGQAGIITDNNYNNANILDVDKNKILDIIKDGKIPVVAGFQGITKDGFITTIGRGGSDVTAALLGAALKADKVVIYTDVDGIMTTDPRIVPEASLIKEINYEEIFQFAEQGAKVIHPRAVEIAKKNGIPLLIKNTMSESEGTLIGDFYQPDLNKVVTGITNINGRTQFRVKCCNENYFKLFDTFAENNISLDLINVFPKEKIFTVDQEYKDKTESIINNFKLQYEIIDRCSKISIIGSGMKGKPGVMARILTALTRKKVEVLQTADSHMTIWCLVREDDVKNAIKSLHEEFKL